MTEHIFGGNMDLEYVKQKLLNCKKKRITRQFLAEDILDIPSHQTEELYEKISLLISNNVIRANIKSGTNGNHLYPLYNKYTITAAPDENVIRQIRELHPLISKSTYLRENPGVFKQYEQHFIALSNYLFRNTYTTPVSRKERAYEIFGIEKLLEPSKDNIFAKELSKIGINSNTLNYYDTPEYCFHDYIEYTKKPSKNMLLVICENKDIWFNIRKYMHESGTNDLYGHRINGVIYGEGNRISSPNSLTNYLNFAHINNATLLYCGDIDIAGIRILQSTIAANPTLDIKPFEEMYKKMLTLAKDKGPAESLEKCNTKYTMSDTDMQALGNINNSLLSYLNTVLTQNRRIPQEIITYSALKG